MAQEAALKIEDRHDVIARPTFMPAVNHQDLVVLVNRYINPFPLQPFACVQQIPSQPNQVFVQSESASVRSLHCPIEGCPGGKRIFHQEVLALEKHWNAWADHDQSRTQRSQASSYPRIFMAGRHDRRKSLPACLIVAFNVNHTAQERALERTSEYGRLQSLHTSVLVLRFCEHVKNWPMKATIPLTVEAQSTHGNFLSQRGVALQVLSNHHLSLQLMSSLSQLL
mmetsp:Transcript_29650/g.69885  ORF Transcript_29650/g.69885 Transcript_29650/m.69885 type:complete len:225 (+) Transcript_29650:837-1511(+)